MNIIEFQYENPHPFLIDEDGHVDLNFYTNASDIGGEDWLVGSLFFPSSYEKDVGRGNPIYARTVDGVSEFRPLLSARLIDFLEMQGPGCTDLYIPFKTVIDGTVYVYTGDGGSGDSLLTCPEAEWDKHEALRLIEDYHLGDWDPNEDEEW